MPAQPDLSGVVLDGRYQIVERLAEGAMGVVYRGVRTQLGRAVAIKVMHATLPGAMAARERFDREAKLMALLEHPHCVSVIDVGLHDDKPYVVMELVRGRSLHEMLVEQGRFEVPRAADIVRQVLSGLAHAHDQGIIHRDVKPANVMVTPKAPLGLHARILDFGLARLCSSNTMSLTDGVAVGTPSYMAPEQCRGDKVDERVDIYACGVVLFELVAGRKPFVADDPIAVIRKHLDQPPPRLADVAPGEYGGLEDVVARALAKLPGDRYPNAVAMSEAIDGAVTERSAGVGAADKTSSFRDDEPASIAVDSAMIESSAIASGAKTSVRRVPPKSRLRYAALAIALVLAAGGYASYRYVLAPAPPPAAAATLEVAIADARAAAPTDVVPHAQAAVTAYDAGRTYFAKMWWTDGIKSFREAIRLDPSYREEPELLRTAVHGFSTTPSYDDRLGEFLVYLGSAAAPYVDEVARAHGNPQIRARATAMLRRLH